MKKSVTKAIAILMVFSVMFSGMPYLAGSLDVHAATSKKKITLKATVTGQTEVKLKWSKIKKPGKGYAVFRDGKAIKRLSSKKTAFTDKGLEPGSTHKYQIKTFTKKKVTKWYNKKTGKWQTKKPAKKYRGKSKKVTKYTYKKKSNIITAQTAPSEEGTKDNSAQDPADNADNTSDDGTKDSAGQNPSDNTSDDGTKNDPAQAPSDNKSEDGTNDSSSQDSTDNIPEDGTKDSSSQDDPTDNMSEDGTKDSSSQDPTDNTSDSETGSVPVPEIKTVTNYAGRTTEIYKYPNENVWRYSSNDVVVESMASIDKTVDGEFETTSGHMVQYHGATFNVTQIDNIEPDNYDYTVQMYNGDASKFSIDLEDGVYIDGRNTFKETGNHVYEPITKYYYFKNGHPIAMPHTTDGKFVYKTETSDNITKKHFIVINAAMSVGDALGIWTDTFDVYVKYDGKIIRTITIDTTRDEYFGTNWTVQTANGMSPWRRVALDIADQAIAAKGGSTGNLNRDLRLIGDYIEETYTYGEQVSVQDTYMDMKCLAGAIVLETYSIYRFGKYGFESSGSNYASGTHSAFNLDEDPRTYYEANGRLN